MLLPTLVALTALQAPAQAPVAGGAPAPATTAPPLLSQQGARPLFYPSPTTPANLRLSFPVKLRDNVAAKDLAATSIARVSSVRGARFPTSGFAHLVGEDGGERIDVEVPRDDVGAGDVEVELGVRLAVGGAGERLLIQALNPAPVVSAPSKKELTVVLFNPFAGEERIDVDVAETGGALGLVRARMDWADSGGGDGLSSRGRLSCTSATSDVKPKGPPTRFQCTVNGFAYRDLGVVNGTLRLDQDPPPDGDPEAVSAIPTIVNVRVTYWAVPIAILVGILIAFIIRFFIEPRLRLREEGVKLRAWAEARVTDRKRYPDPPYQKQIAVWHADLEAKIAVVATAEATAALQEPADKGLAALDQRFEGDDKEARAEIGGIRDALLVRRWSLTEDLRKNVSVIASIINDAVISLEQRVVSAAKEQVELARKRVDALPNDADNWVRRALAELGDPHMQEVRQAIAALPAVPAETGPVAAAAALTSVECGLAVLSDKLRGALTEFTRDLEGAAAHAVAPGDRLAKRVASATDEARNAVTVDQQRAALLAIELVAPHVSREILAKVPPPSRAQAEQLVQQGKLAEAALLIPPTGAPPVVLGGPGGGGTASPLVPSPVPPPAREAVPPPRALPPPAPSPSAAPPPRVEVDGGLRRLRWILIILSTTAIGSATQLQGFVGTPHDLVAAFSWGLGATITLEGLLTLAGTLRRTG